MGKKLKIAAIAGFVLIVIGAIYDANAEPTIAIGQTFNKSYLPYGEVGYEWRDWEVNYGQIGEGETDYGDQEVVDVYSVSYLVRPRWCLGQFCNYYRLGAAYVDETPLIGPTNYRLGIGFEHKYVQLEYFHFSSAGIWENNGGIDGLQLRLKLPLE